jgi:thiosulfate/3-mercaptopyruvate sulfurtransferase
VFTTIVSVSELAGHLGDPGWIVVDCRHLLQDFGAGRRLYEAAHVPGAFFADAERDLAGRKTGKNGRHPLPKPEDFAAFLRELGAGDETQLVAYDSGADMWAARFWFLARYIGHRAAAVLDGGFNAWAGMGSPVTTHVPARPRNGSITAKADPGLTVSAHDVLESLQDRRFLLVDARSPDRFAGRNETIDPIGGHIPGAVNRPFRENYWGPLGFMKPPEVLHAEFEVIGIPAERAVHQCGSGVSATVNLLAMEHAGLSGARLYAGSWSEWCSDPSRPMATASAAEEPRTA